MTIPRGYGLAIVSGTSKDGPTSNSNPTMIRIFLALCFLAGSFALNSCCCITGEPKAPKLSPLPGFQELPAAPEVIAEK